uniref:hypothetical protein n=1 Tax=Pseudomonas mohnii TaxID=395600 RepID=UPI001A7EE7B4
ALFISLMAFVGYLFDVSALYSVGLYSSMAIHTAIVRIPRPSGHLFHEHPATDSTVIRPLIPRSTGHP